MVKAQLICVLLSFGYVASILAPPARAERTVLSSTNSAVSFADSFGVEISADGKWAVFSSNALAPQSSAAPSQFLQVFLRNLETGETTLLSRNSATEPGNGHSTEAVISADGRWIAFESLASNLVAGDTNRASDIFLYDRTSHSLQRISTPVAQEGASTGPNITPDGRFILFQSEAVLASADTNRRADLYLYETAGGATTLITANFDNSVAAGGGLANAGAGYFQEQMSADARYIVFRSQATNLVSNSPQFTAPQIFLRDTVGQTNIWLTRTSIGTAARETGTAVVSKNGNAVAFISATLEPPGLATFVYYFDTATHALTSLMTSERTVSELSISADGQQIAVADSGAAYVIDVASKQTTLVAVDASGGPALYPSATAQLSDDGTTLILSSAATNVVGGGTSGNFQLYKYDIKMRQPTLLTPGITGGGANSDILFPDITADGTVATFTSFATNLSPADDKNSADVFLTSGTGAITSLSGSSHLTLSIQSHSDSISIDVTGGNARLQEAPAISGPWADVADAQLPHTETISPLQRAEYFRAKLQN
jgi:Tol biopolymer transport system component